jgi:hypothetical protein
MIYFIQDTNNKRIKIGKSDSPIRRIRRFRTGMSNPGELEILAVIPGGVKREKDLHQKFQKYHSHGEWFEPSNEIIEFIEENTTGTFNFCRICGALHLSKPDRDDIEGHARIHVNMRIGVFPYGTRELMKTLARCALVGEAVTLDKSERLEAKRMIALSWWARARQSGLNDSMFDDYMLDHLELLDAQIDGVGNLAEINKRIGETWKGK